MNLNDLFQLGTTIVAAAAALDAVIPPNSNKIFGPLKRLVSFIALNFGHSQNIAPTQAVRDKQGS